MIRDFKNTMFYCYINEWITFEEQYIVKGTKSHPYKDITLLSNLFMPYFSSNKSER